MKKTAILDYKKSKVLRQSAKSVPIDAIGSRKIGSIISKMKKALRAEEDGVAIAAPQIGESLRIFVVSGRALVMARKKKADTLKEFPDLVFINPEIVKASKKKKKMEEGCLSVRWLYGQVNRHEKVTLKAHDETGKLLNVGASGLLAQIFQHEIDHLNGILFIDKAENVQNLPPNKNE